LITPKTPPLLAGDEDASRVFRGHVSEHMSDKNFEVIVGQDDDRAAESPVPSLGHQQERQLTLKNPKSGSRTRRARDFSTHDPLNFVRLAGE